LHAGFLILYTQFIGVGSKPVGEMEMTTQTTYPPPVTSNARNLLTVLEVAEWARVHPKTVYRWIREGRLEAIQFGPRTFRVPEDAITQFLRQTGYEKPYSSTGKTGRRQT